MFSDENKLIGPFKFLGKDVEGYFSVEKNFWKPFGEYKFTMNHIYEFSANEITRRIHIPGYNKFELLETLDFKDDNEIIRDFKCKLNKVLNRLIAILRNLSDILSKTYKIKSA